MAFPPLLRKLGGEDAFVERMDVISIFLVVFFI